MRDHKAVEREREREREMRDHNTVEICDRSQSSREREMRDHKVI